MDENIMTEAYKDALKTLLSKNKLLVNFTKGDGTIREMLCTTNLSFIPAENLSVEGSRRSNRDVQVVFDLEKQAWRSFRFDSVNSFLVKG